MRTKSILRKTHLRRVSLKRQREGREYTKLRAAFLEDHPFCQVTIRLLGLCEEEVKEWSGMHRTALGNIDVVPQSIDIHHKHGRTGTNYLDTTTWLAVSRFQHERIHNNPSWARSHGFLK